MEIFKTGGINCRYYLPGRNFMKDSEFSLNCKQLGCVNHELSILFMFKEKGANVFVLAKQ